MTLNGQWDFGFTDKFGGKITVPFCWESELSGVHKMGETTGWYKKTFRIPPIMDRQARLAAFRCRR